MRREEVQDFLAMFEAFYPSFKPADLTATVNAWHMILEDVDKDIAVLALKQYVQTNNSAFAPTAGQLINLIYGTTDPLYPNGMEAWQMVMRAMERGGFDLGRCYTEEFGKLPEVVQKSVGSPEQLRSWALTENFNEEVARSNFLSVYSIEVRRAQEYSRAPDGLKAVIDKANEGSPRELLHRRNAGLIEASRRPKIEERYQGIPCPDEFRNQVNEKEVSSETKI